MTAFATLRLGHYAAILADPAWKFRVRSSKGEGRSASRHYDTMPLADIKALPVRELAAKNCVLFLWVTDPMQAIAHDVIAAWGFTFKTVGFYWVKQNRRSDRFFRGTGYWTRANPEQCLLAVRGAPKRVRRDVLGQRDRKIRPGGGRVITNDDDLTTSRREP